MSDYCKCKGVSCAQRDTCYRYTSRPGPRQSWFVTEPMEATGECEYLIPTSKESNG